jgi:hypothetical protein
METTLFRLNLTLLLLVEASCLNQKAWLTRGGTTQVAQSMAWGL